MFFGKIRCRALKNVAVVEDGLKLRGEEVADLVSSDSYFEGDIDDNIYRKGKVSGTDDIIRQFTEGEMLGNTHVSGYSSKFGVPELGISLRETLGEEIGDRRGSTGVFSGGNDDGKPEDYLIGDTMIAGYSDVW